MAGGSLFLNFPGGMLVKNKVIVITGAGKGLGRAYALHFAGLGASVVVNNRRHPGENVSSADQTVEEIRSQGGSAVAEYSSIEASRSGKDLLTCALDVFGRIDALVANAGVTEGVAFRKQSLDDFREVIEINLFGTVNVVQPIFRHMYDQRKGSILLSTSVAGLFGEHGLPAYSTAKAAVLGLMYSLSQEAVPAGVRVNAIAPYGWTQMTQEHLPRELAPLLSPAQVAPVVAWLVSDECEATGEIVISGGGRTARARMLATDGRPTPANTSVHWEMLRTLPLDRQYRSSMDHFREWFAGTDRRGDAK